MATKRSRQKKGATVKKSRNSSLSPWVWMLIGVVVTGLLFGAYHVFLKSRLEQLAHNANNSSYPVQQLDNNDSRESNTAKLKKPIFDFYTLLPESEAVYSSNSDNTQNPNQQNTVNNKISNLLKKSHLLTSIASKKKDSQPLTTLEDKHPQALPPKDGENSFLLQAGSFIKPEDADKLRAQLLLWGMSARIKKVSLSNNKTYYRVQLGPFKGKPDLINAQKKLTSHDIEALTLRLR